MTITRRSFFRLIAGAAIAPVASKASMVLPDVPILYGDGIHDDTVALQALIDGKTVEFFNPEMAKNAGWFGNPFSGNGALLRFPAGKFRVNKPLILSRRGSNKAWNNVMIDGAGSTVMLDKGTYAAIQVESARNTSINSFTFFRPCAPLPGGEDPLVRIKCPPQTSTALPENLSGKGRKP